jgi:hypothetical protein
VRWPSPLSGSSWNTHGGGDFGVINETPCEVKRVVEGLLSGMGGQNEKT